MIGEFSYNPYKFNKKSCYYCAFFVSFAEEYEDDLEPADVGRCHFKEPYETKDFDETCDNFKGSQCAA